MFMPPLFLIQLGNRQYVASLGMVLLLNPAVYAAAVMMTVLVRHAVYAAILGLGVVVGSAGAAVLAWTALKWAGWIEDSSLTHSLYLCAGLTVCVFLCTVVAWRASKNDWGWKSRY
jgi:hypothetical protein